MTTNFDNFGHRREVVAREGLVVMVPDRETDQETVSELCAVETCELIALGSCLHCGHLMCGHHLSHDKHNGLSINEPLFTPAPRGVGIIVRRDPNAPVVADPMRRTENMTDADITNLLVTMRTIVVNARNMRRNMFWDLVCQQYCEGKSEEKHKTSIQLKAKFATLKDKEKWKTDWTEINSLMTSYLANN